MEAVRTPDAPPPPKLTIEKFADGTIACLKLAGTIDEGFEGAKLGASTGGDVLVVDLGGVKKISSFGIREWVDFITTASKRVRSVVLIECAPKVVDQLNMVANFAGGGRVFSFYAPFRCDYCDSEHRVLLQVDRDHEAIKTAKLAERPCPSCQEAMYFDEDGATYFSYVLGQERFELEPAVAEFLARRLAYAVSDLTRKLRVDKVIDGRTTYLRLTGDLDATFPRDKLADGLEGVVIVDLGGLGRIEPAGAAAWRGFVQAAAAVVERLHLAHVPPAFLEKLAGADDLGPKAEVVTLTLPYTCGGCRTTSAQLIDVTAHHEVLKFATAPELRCATCRTAMTSTASETLMALLPELPKPTASDALVKSIGILRERAGAQLRKPARPSASQPQAPAPAPRSPLLVPFLAALLAIVVAAAGYLAYQRLVGDGAVPAVTITKRSAPARPAWITTDGTVCTDTAARGIACVGVSSRAPRLDDAEAEAADAAYDAVAQAIAARIAAPAWKAAVPGLYAASREAKLSAFDREPSSTSAYRDVREARRAVAAALRATGGAHVPATPTARYWEEYGDQDGKRYVAFAQLQLAPTAIAGLVAAYGTPAQALGATVVTAFPLVAWRHPRVERGAILAALASGPLQDAGLAAPYVVLSINGRDTVDAPAFAAIAGEEHARLARRGGTLRLKVQTADPAPREFSAEIAGAALDADAGARRAPRATSPSVPTGSVNVWDRYDRNGSGRDDPDQ